MEGATFLTERQGGSDVGANEVSAEAAGSDAYGEVYRITGEKYFASNTGMAGVAMVLARIPGAEEGTKGLSLFLVPWKKTGGKPRESKAVKRQTRRASRPFSGGGI